MSHATESRPIPVAVAADVVNAFVDPVIEVVGACLGIDARLGKIAVTTEIDPPPMISVIVDVRGSIAGPITCSVSESLARAAAGWLLHEPALDTFDLSTCSLAVAELLNVIAGSAMGRLVEAGYQVELLPPRVPAPDEDGRFLIKRALVVPFDTAAGGLKIVFGVRVGA